MTKETKEKDSNARFNVDLHIRLTKDERRVVQAKADEWGCKLSQAARAILFKKLNTVTLLSGREAEHQRLLEMKGTRAEFKRIAASYNAFVDSYSRSVELTDRDGNPVVSTELTLRVLNSLEGLTMKLQASLNELLRESGQNEEHSFGRSRLTDGNLGKEKEVRAEDEEIVVRTDNVELEVNYSNMERMMIIGKLPENASKYKAGNKGEKLRFKVSCESLGKNGAKSCRTYTVFWRDTDIAGRLLQGVSVFVEGTFAQDDNRENLLFADVVKFASE